MKDGPHGKNRNKKFGMSKRAVAVNPSEQDEDFSKRGGPKGLIYCCCTGDWVFFAGNLSRPFFRRRRGKAANLKIGELLEGDGIEGVFFCVSRGFQRGGGGSCPKGWGGEGLGSIFSITFVVVAPGG